MTEVELRYIASERWLMDNSAQSFIDMALQAYQAGKAAALEDTAKKVEEVHEFYGVSPAETIRGMK